MVNKLNLDILHAAVDAIPANEAADYTVVVYVGEELVPHRVKAIYANAETSVFGIVVVPE